MTNYADDLRANREFYVNMVETGTLVLVIVWFSKFNLINFLTMTSEMFLLEVIHTSLMARKLFSLHSWH